MKTRMREFFGSVGEVLAVIVMTLVVFAAYFAVTYAVGYYFIGAFIINTADKICRIQCGLYAVLVVSAILNIVIGIKEVRDKKSH